jgi:hypothetical protein
MCIYGIFKDDLGFYCFQRRETTRSKEDITIVNMSQPKNPQQIQIFNGWHNFKYVLSIKIATIMAPITKLNKKKRLLFG